jgi:uncharacterized protein (DUF1800 family)
MFDPQIEHLLRRAGFGARSDELDRFRRMTITDGINYLVDYDQIPDDVDSHIGQSGYVGVNTTRGPLAPQSNIVDARERWLFRMLHTNRPLQEKMTLFWHNHFATGYTKIAGLSNAAEGARYMAAKASEDPGKVRGQIEMLRDNALGNFQDILINVAKDTAMLFWLDGKTNTKNAPQENFGRELMELFTMGVGHYTEPDVYAAARVFTGWNTTRPGSSADGSQHYEFNYVPGNHETTAKTFSFPIYSDGSKTIPARSAASGMQDGLDLIAALAGNPNTGQYLATKLYRFFISETGDVDQQWVSRIASVYFEKHYDMKEVLRAVLFSPEFWQPQAYFARYAWPVEYVVRSLKDIGYVGFSVFDALTPLSNMGQVLYDPPDVSGWDLGQSWFSTGAMLSRMNFASQIAGNQKFRLATAAQSSGATADKLLTWALDQVQTSPMDTSVKNELSAYLTSTGPWTGSATQLQAKVPGLVHLVAGSPEYQFV